MYDDSADVLQVGDLDRQEAAVLDYLRTELDRLKAGTGRRATEQFVLAAMEGVTWIGAFIATGAALRGQGHQLRADSLLAVWLEQHERKFRRLHLAIGGMRARFEEMGEEVRERIESEEYLQLVRKGFAVWDRADTDEKRRYVANLLANAGGGTRLASDDVVRLFIEWIDQYHEAHFTVIRQIHQHPGATRLAIWQGGWGAVPRENSAEADLYRRLIRDLSVGGVIRQRRDVDAFGKFIARAPKKPAAQGTRPSTLESSFDNDDPYELTELGKQFVHYTMNELVLRIEGRS